MPNIKLKEVSKSYKQKTVLHALDLNLETEKTHVLLGSSGCGKSTIIRLISGLIAPTTGNIYIDNQKVKTKNQKEIARSMGYVIQEGGLFPHFTAERNITLAARLQGWTEENCKLRLEELFDLVQLDTQLLKRYPRELSGGQRQRMSLMRALFMGPDILLLDEPLGALDPLVRSALQKELKEIFNRLNKTVVIVTHDIAEAAFFGHTITLLDEGKLQQHGSFSTLLKDPENEFVENFIFSQRPPKELVEMMEL